MHTVYCSTPSCDFVCTDDLLLYKRLHHGGQDVRCTVRVEKFVQHSLRLSVSKEPKLHLGGGGGGGGGGDSDIIVTGGDGQKF